jgi:hypothetical protein
MTVLATAASTAEEALPVPSVFAVTVSVAVAPSVTLPVAMIAEAPLTVTLAQVPPQPPIWVICATPIGVEPGSGVDGRSRDDDVAGVAQVAGRGERHLSVRLAVMLTPGRFVPLSVSLAVRAIVRPDDRRVGSVSA